MYAPLRVHVTEGTREQKKLIKGAHSKLDCQKLVWEMSNASIVGVKDK